MRQAPNLKAARRFLLVAGLLFACVGVSAVGGHYLVGQTLPPNARLTTDAFHALNKGDWHTAISKAAECIEQFQDSADDEQKELEAAKATVPNGEVPDDARKEILRRGPLNDVATCLLIKGEASEKLGLNADAKQAYEAATRYTFARCYDPSWNGFWSPSERARSLLRHLK